MFDNFLYMQTIMNCISWKWVL